MKTEQEIKELAHKYQSIESIANKKYGFVEGYTQAQTDMQAEMLAKDAEIAQLKVELQDVKEEIAFRDWCVRDGNYIDDSEEVKINVKYMGVSMYSKSELRELYQESKTQAHGK